MSNTAVLNHPVRWVNPLSTPEVIDLDDALVPRCPRTGRTIMEREAEVERRVRHHDNEVRKELAKQRRGKSELSEAQNRMLFSGHPSVNPQMFNGYKLTRRQKAQLKLLKKQWGRDVATQPVLSLVKAS